jgi:hypothetical protein
MSNDMNNNPYSPPNAPVADVLSLQGYCRPASINVVLTLFLAPMALALIHATFQWWNLRSAVPLASIIVTAVLTTTLIGWLSYKIWQGRNWARIVMLVLFVIGVLISGPQLPAMFARSRLAAGIFVVQSAAQFAALCIVFFTPARRWFSKVERMPNKPLQPTCEDARA